MDRKRTLRNADETSETRSTKKRQKIETHCDTVDQRAPRPKRGVNIKRKEKQKSTPIKVKNGEIEDNKTCSDEGNTASKHDKINIRAIHKDREPNAIATKTRTGAKRNWRKTEVEKPNTETNEKSLPKVKREQFKRKIQQSKGNQKQSKTSFNKLTEKKGKVKIKAEIIDEENISDEEGKAADISDSKSSGDESEDIDWEDVQETEGCHDDHDDLSAAGSSTVAKSENKSVEISIEIPGMKGKKKKKAAEDMMTTIRKAIERFKKQVQLNIHKAHLLMLVSWGFSRNAVCNEPCQQALCLSYVPSKLISKSVKKWQQAELTTFLAWFKEDFPSLHLITDTLQENNLINKAEYPQNMVEVLVIVMRSLGLLTRLVSSLQPVSMKIAVDNKASLKRKTPSQQSKSPQTVAQQSPVIDKSPKGTGGTRGKSKKALATSKETKTESNELSGSTANAEATCKSVLTKTTRPSPTKRCSPPTNQRKTSASTLSSNSSSPKPNKITKKNSNERKEAESRAKKKKLRKPRKVDYTVNGTSSNSEEEEIEDEEDFELFEKEIEYKKPRKLSSKHKQCRSTPKSKESLSLVGEDVWIEVYIPVRKSWFCIDVVSYSINQPELCEEHASQPLSYVLAYDNENSVKDVTERYASNWLSKIQKSRIDADWWDKTLLPYKTKKKKMDEQEDSQLLEKLQDKPLPQSINEFKSHPLYVLKRHLLKFEAIYPESAATHGFIRGEAVYSRDCVHLLHTRDKWMSTEARVVKQGEDPYKVVKGRVKRNQPVVDPNSVTCDLFGFWQTEVYQPPPAKDGKVPRNEYGNVELFKPSMLPPGTTHIQIPGIQKVAKKLGIDGALAIVGFDFHGGFNHPKIDGFVVCTELVPALMDAWNQELKDAKIRKEEKREKRVFGHWKLFVKSLLIKERLKRKYETQESRSSEQGEQLEENDKILNTAVSWPQNIKGGKTSVDDDGHCHVFPKKLNKKNKVTGDWTKSCSCGHTLPLEK